MSKLNIYQQQGFRNRYDYLLDLADSYGIDSYVVFELADMLGDGEDFDGLVTELEDLTTCNSML
jgi:hypothetical protein